MEIVRGIMAEAKNLTNSPALADEIARDITDVNQASSKIFKKIYRLTTAPMY